MNSREDVSSNTSQNYQPTFASAMQFTANFVALAFAVVAATTSQVAASPAPVGLVPAQCWSTGTHSNDTRRSLRPL